LLLLALIDRHYQMNVSSYQVLYTLLIGHEKTFFREFEEVSAAVAILEKEPTECPSPGDRAANRESSGFNSVHTTLQRLEAKGYLPP
jgi:hypothetical protein